MLFRSEVTREGDVDNVRARCHVSTTTTTTNVNVTSLLQLHAAVRVARESSFGDMF